MSENNGKATQQTLNKQRRKLRLFDVALTLGVILVVVAIFLVMNRAGGENGGGSFVKFNPFTGRIPTSGGPEIGKTAPDFEIELLDGGTFRLSEQEGKIVWLNFWASWCPPCRAETPDIQQVWSEEQGSDLMLVAVNYAEKTQTVEEFDQRLGLTFPIGLDTTGQITTNYRVTGFPSHFLVDKNGVLREIWVGTMSQSAMHEKLEKVRGY